LEDEGAAHRWVRASGGTTFEALVAAVPGYLPQHPPTSDLITLAGAFTACTHDSAGYFADHVRRFTLLTPDGVSHQCHADAPGLAGELYRLVPGSFGVLGVILDLELRMIAAPDSGCVGIVVHRGRYRDDPALSLLATLAASPATHTAGLYVYGVGGETVVFESRRVDASTMAGVLPLPLTDEATTRNVYLQAIASLQPRLTNWFSLFLLTPGRRFRASLYGNSFFQRSYGRAYPILGGRGVLARALRGLGLNPRLPVAHQTFVIPPASIEGFFAIYFEILARHPKLVRRLEQQDAIRLPECHWPLHAAHGMPDGCFFVTTSMGVERDGESEREARAFFAEVAERTFDAVGAKTLLLKHTHVAATVLRAMHAPMITRLLALKATVDPKSVLYTQFLHALT
jgi:FAD/FMN-containing dehydrogenase